MKKLYCFLIFVLICGFASANLFSEIFKKDAKSHTQSQSQIVKDRKTFQKSCISNPTNYGVQIYCKSLSSPLSFIAEQSPALKCAQTTMGVSSNFPTSITLSTQFINTLNDCSGKIYGPNYVRTILFKTENNKSVDNFVEYNRSDTYYDIVCINKSSYYESYLYTKMQRDVLNEQNKQYQNCLNNIPEPQVQKFRYIFYLFVSIALIALIIFLIKNFKKT